MTERGQDHVQRSPHRFAIGPSQLLWQNGQLQVDIDEVANPLPRRVRGSVTVTPMGLSQHLVELDDAGRHRWGPIAPCARIQVSLQDPALSWSGHAYIDSNEGEEPISEPFTTWDWLRASLPDGSTVVVYDVQQSGGRSDRLFGTRFWPDGRTEEVLLPERQRLPRSRWQIERQVRCEEGAAAQVLRTLEDTPFYARSVVQTQLCGHTVQAMHESLSATRFASPVVQAMLPWRMPRRS